MTDNAGMTRPRIRVAAYVIRNRAVPEVLVFDLIGMPEAGTQVPAGGVRATPLVPCYPLRRVRWEGLPADGDSSKAEPRSGDTFVTVHAACAP